MQALGITTEAVRANIAPRLNTFMPQADLDILLAGESEQGPVLVASNSLKKPVVVTADTYRLPLVTGTPSEVHQGSSGTQSRSTALSCRLVGAASADLLDMQAQTSA